MSELFSYDGKVGTFIQKCTELLMINTFWLFCCIPVITIGPSTTAMYYAINKSISHGRGYAAKEFFRSFKENLKQGIAIWVIYLTVGIWFAQDIYYFYNQWKNGNSIGILWYLFAGFMVILVLLAVYSFAYLARFENTVRKTIKESFLIMFLHFGLNIKIVAILLIAALAVYLEKMFLLILPVILMFVFCRPMEKIFRKYISEEELELEDARNQQPDE